METFILTNRILELCVTPKWGAILYLHYKKTPILRENPNPLNATDTACFPLIPFGNRLEGNQIIVDDFEYVFSPNTDDEFYLHGDGWLAEWEHMTNRAKLSLSYKHNGTFQYIAKQNFALKGNSVIIELEIQNIGNNPIICGLGWHPYFLKHKELHLKTQCSFVWGEQDNYLPINKKPCTPINEIVANKWINSCYEGWDGKALITTDLYQVQLLTDMKYFQLYSTEDSEFFCFEPMEHRTNGFIDWHDNGLVKILPNETHKQTMTLKFMGH